VALDIDARVPFLAKGGREEGVQLSLHDTIGHELSLLADLWASNYSFCFHYLL
jgi:hypothetical protein